MRERHPSVHALVIAPKTFEGIRAERVGKRDDDDKERECAEYPRAPRTILRVHERERKPSRRHYFDENTEGEVFPRDEGKEKRRRHQKRNEREEKYRSEDGPAECLLKYHGGIVSPASPFYRSNATVVILKAHDVFFVECPVGDFDNDTALFGREQMYLFFPDAEYLPFPERNR